ncbi:MAG TPA: 4Fe-4S binding protein [Dissulfurispiraceae bacterium]|nr:4Fe-4S binding protein [Dissulfurispiraceae bacterium]
MSRRPKGKIVIDKEQCKGCGYCIEACTKNSIFVDTRFNKAGFFPADFTHPERCTGCAMCAMMCPEMAIEVWKEEK